MKSRYYGLNTNSFDRKLKCAWFKTSHMSWIKLDIEWAQSEMKFDWSFF